MLGRAAYHDPYFLAQADWRAFGDDAPARSRADVLRALMPYARRSSRAACRCGRSRGTCSGSITAVRAGGASGRSCPTRRSCKTPGPELFLEALAAVEPRMRWRNLRSTVASDFGHVVGDVRADDALEIRVGVHAERGAELRREIRRPRRHDPVDRRVDIAT